jgi:hypothetical protein
MFSGYKYFNCFANFTLEKASVFPWQDFFGLVEYLVRVGDLNVPLYGQVLLALPANVRLARKKSTKNKH